MILSKSCIYAIRASLLVSLHQKDGDDYVPVRVISDTLGLSFHFLTKILHGLTQADLMESFRGPNGGVRLARPSSQIRLIDIVAATDGTEKFSECVLGLSGCGSDKPCPLHDQWSKRRDQLLGMFEKATVSSLSKKLKEQDLRS